MEFSAKQAVNDVTEWIRNWFLQNGNGCKAVVGISGGKDSSVTAALCAKALGKDRVFGVLMPNGVQSDIDVAKRVCEHVGIEYAVINIEDAYKGIMGQLEKCLPQVSRQSVINLPPRLRMSSLYAVSQSVNGRVANTCNLSEDWVGYSTRYGDSVGDFSPLSSFTVSEVKQMGYELGLPQEFIEKAPSDGLSGKTDEDNLGFTYAMLDKYIRTGICEDEEKKQRIDALHEMNKFKLELMPSFQYSAE